MFCYKIKFNSSFFLLRGNHEASTVNFTYGFYDECIHNFKLGKRKYNVKLWKLFGVVFNWMPVSALIDDKIFCMHGGLSKDLEEIAKIKEQPTR